VDRCRKGGPPAAARLLGRRWAVLAQLDPQFGGFVGQGRPGGGTGGGLEICCEEGTTDALVETTLALAREHHLLLALDDVQWADARTRAFLEALRADRLSGLPLVVVAASRSDPPRPEVDALIERSRARRLPLAPLDEHALSQLVGDLLALPSPPAELVKLMQRRSLGNPGRVIEALRDAAAEGLLVRRRGQWVLTQRPARAFWLRRTVRLEGPVGAEHPAMGT
jgi:hypothetical protein